MTIFDKHGRLYQGILVVIGDEAFAHTTGQDEPLYVSNVTPALVKKAVEIGYMIIWV